MSNFARNPHLSRIIDECTSKPFNETNLGHFVFMNGVKSVDIIADQVSRLVYRLVNNPHFSHVMTRKKQGLLFSIKADLLEEYQAKIEGGKLLVGHNQGEEYSIAQKELRKYLDISIEQAINKVLEMEQCVRIWEIKKNREGYFVYIYF